MPPAGVAPPGEPVRAPRCRRCSARDVVRPEAAQAVSMLSSIGVRAAMLTGDAPAAAAGVGAATGIPTPRVHARLLPGEKLAKVRALGLAGPGSCCAPATLCPAVDVPHPPHQRRASRTGDAGQPAGTHPWHLPTSFPASSNPSPPQPPNPLPPITPNPGCGVQAGRRHPSCRRRLLPRPPAGRGLLRAGRRRQQRRRPRRRAVRAVVSQEAAAGRLGGARRGRGE